MLINSKDELSDVKISPDSKFVSFVRDHNLFLVTTADGKERAFTTGGTENLRKGELDWVYPEELELYTAYWWAPDSLRNRLSRDGRDQSVAILPCRL